MKELLNRIKFWAHTLLVWIPVFGAWLPWIDKFFGTNLAVAPKEDAVVKMLTMWQAFWLIVAVSQLYNA